MEEKASAIDFTRPQLLLSQLHQHLNSCAQSLASEVDAAPSDPSVRDLVNFLSSVCDAALSDPYNGTANDLASAILAELCQFTCSPSSSQMVVDALSLELPMVVAKFAGVSDKCREIAETIVDHLVAVCSPREMLSILCEALDLFSKSLKAPVFLLPLFSGFSKVFPFIQRRQYEQVKAALPVILTSLKVVLLESDSEDKDTQELASRAIDIATSIHTVIQTSMDKRKKDFYALLGLYVLQIVAFVTSQADESSIVPLILRLTQFLSPCGFSYVGLITGSNVVASTSMLLEEDRDDFIDCFSSVKVGASLAVIWGLVYDEIAKAAEEDLTVVKDKLRSGPSERWKAIIMLGHLLSDFGVPWKIKGRTVEFLLNILDEVVSWKCDVNHSECSSYVPSLFSALQAVEKFIMHAPDAELRKKAFVALRRVLADIPSCHRFDTLKALITRSSSSSMMAILMDLVREEILMESHQKNLPTVESLKLEDNDGRSSLLWSSKALDLVEHVLKPPQGGPPSLPEQSEAVVSALNLYRLLLIMESAGRVSCTGILLEKNLRKAYAEWFLPLRTLVLGIEAENQKDYDEIASSTICSLNPVQLVLCRCIELVEENLEKLKQCK